MEKSELLRVATMVQNKKVVTCANLNVKDISTVKYFVPYFQSPPGLSECVGPCAAARSIPPPLNVTKIYFYLTYEN